MYDSEEDVERRGRDKFPRERDYRRDDDRRGSGFIRNDYSNGAQKRSSSGRRDDYGAGPGAKRGRIDNASDTFDPVIRSSDDTSACTMMTFKKFLMSQEDDISDEDAIAKYNEYKLDFKRQQLQKFFNAHKDEEWLVCIIRTPVPVLSTTSILTTTRGALCRG
uniref:DUF3546 domain-containing protein n=1 Tax=Heterorhabditis bacteriophora TaxID=37862 RepID=A0A1I7XSQ0_HETBA